MARRQLTIYFAIILREVLRERIEPQTVDSENFALDDLIASMMIIGPITYAVSN